MNTITIDTNIYKKAEFFARSSNVSIREFIEKAILSAMPRPLANADVAVLEQHDVWHEYKISPEVIEMTFEHRKDVPNDYDTELQNNLIEKYQ